MRLRIGGIDYIETLSPVVVTGEPDITVGWNMYSATAGLGISPLGIEQGGFAGTFPPNIRYAFVQVADTGTGGVVHQSEAILPNEVEWTYPAAQNKLDHGGSYQRALTFTVLLVGPTGAQSDYPPNLQTT